MGEDTDIAIVTAVATAGWVAVVLLAYWFRRARRRRAWLRQQHLQRQQHQKG